MTMKRVLLLLKPFDVYPPRLTNGDHITSSKILRHLDDRCRVHKETINHCKNIIQKKASIKWDIIMRNNLSHPIRNIDLVITIGGDGTLLKASHFLDETVPVLGVNSDPTNLQEVEEMSEEFDATRSTGYLCAATKCNFEQVLDEVLEGKKNPTELARISVKLNGSKLPSYALNDILIAHPCPASVSRFSFRINSKSLNPSNLIHCRSSGLRVATSAGSTAAMQSAGGTPMHISNPDLQFMVREPILPAGNNVDNNVNDNAALMHGFVKKGESISVCWYSQDGVVYFDGAHVFYKIRNGDVAELAGEGPGLNVVLPERLVI